MKKWIRSLVTHALTAVGALLVARGYIDAEAANQFVAANTDVIVGLVTYGIGQLWGIFSKD